MVGQYNDSIINHIHICKEYKVVLFTVYLNLFHIQNGTFGLSKVKVSTAFAHTQTERDRGEEGEGREGNRKKGEGGAPTNPFVKLAPMAR